MKYDWKLNATLNKEVLSPFLLVCFQSGFVRHNTPHPKELRMRYSKLLNKNDIDGHVIEHDPDQDKVRIEFFLLILHLKCNVLMH